MSGTRAVLCLALCFSFSALAETDPAPWERPRLVVVVSVDQLRADYLTRFDGYLPDGGLRRLMREGAWFSNAHYRYASTFTAPGHAVISTGSYAHLNGIVANKVIDESTQTLVDPALDAKTQLVGLPKGTKAVGFSPNRLEGSTIGDELRLATGMAAKVVAITLKPRASVMLAGKLGTPIWFNRDHGYFVSSTHYAPRVPSWVQAFNAKRVPDHAFGTTWNRRGPKAAYGLATADNAPWEALAYGLGRSFPHRLRGANKKKDATFYRAWAFTPAAMKAQLALARAAIETEKLGQDAVPDLLAIGVSTFDFSGHAFGPYSHEMVSLTFDLDELVRNLLALLDQQVGKGRYLLAFTADHGVTAVPEHQRSHGIDAGRIPSLHVTQRVDAALDARFGAETWVLGAYLPFLWLNPKAIAKRKISTAAAERVAAAAASGVKGVANVYTRTRVLAGQLPDSELSRSITRSIHPRRAGNLYVLQRPGWLFHEGTHVGGTRHGTPYNADTHVPLILFGRGVAAGLHAQPVEMIDLAPTLARVLAVSPPNLSEGRPLLEALKPPAWRALKP